MIFKAIHVTNSEDQSGSEVWKKARALLLTASDLKDFLTNWEQVCKKKWDMKKSIANVPAIKWGRDCEPYGILDFERDHGKVTKSGLHVSKAMPNFGNLKFIII